MHDFLTTFACLDGSGSFFRIINGNPAIHYPVGQLIRDVRGQLREVENLSKIDRVLVFPLITQLLVERMRPKLLPSPSRVVARQFELGREKIKEILRLGITSNSVRLGQYQHFGFHCSCQRNKTSTRPSLCRAMIGILVKRCNRCSLSIVFSPVTRAPPLPGGVVAHHTRVGIGHQSMLADGDLGRVRRWCKGCRPVGRSGRQFV